MNSRSRDWPQAIVFDLDGTLIDSAPDIAHALNAATARRGLAPFTLEEVKEMIGGGVPQLVERALVARGFPRSELMPLVEDFLGLYRENLTTHTVVYEGARELLERLRGEGRRLGVCTNKNHELTLAILDRLDLAKYFGAVFGEREGKARKPDAAPLLETLAELNASPEDALMAGDSEADVACARAAKIPVIVVTFGYSKVAPDALGADAVIPALSDLPRWFPALNSMKR
ncbi:MAG: phosphoglycolate phosphatase [Rhodomicrobium sp.]|jgi:phosphoglycolate phosphatase